MATKWNELGMEPLRTLLRHIKSGSVAAIQNEFPGLVGLPTREEIYSELTRRDREITARNTTTKCSGWHVAPDGSDCCCTTDDDRYGCGCGYWR